jgi:geranylgeranyl reductase family protein
MNLSSPALLPSTCDVLVIGAGPAGSSTAHWLARHGRDVLLIDQHDFPREKICGDGLIPDAHAALRRLGLLDEVMARAQGVRHVRCVAPSGAWVDLPGTLAVLPRQQLDHLLVLGAQRAGARLCTPVRLDGLIEEAGCVVGARLRTLGPDEPALHEVRARWVVLATGAPVQAMQIAGLNQRRAPSGVALRGYVRNPQRREQQLTMDVVWHQALRPGYGWIFPVGDDVYNIGVGAFHRNRSDGAATHLRQMFEAFTSVYAPARELMQGGELLGDLKGAPLRCTLDGADYGRAGLLATGEAIGSTYDFTGEGIGKAMETGLLAAEAILAGWADADETQAAVRADYAARLLHLKPRFDLYAKANRINRHPWLADLVIRRARKSERLRQRISGVLNETSNPGNLLTLRGLLRLFS